MASDPLLVLLHSLLPALELFRLTLLFFGKCYHFDRVINHEWELENFSPDIFAARWAFLSSDKALWNALVAERVTTYCNSTGHYKIHTDWASESLHLFEWLESSAFLLIHNSPKIVRLLIFLLNLCVFWLRLNNLIRLDLLRLLTSSQNLRSESILYALNFLNLLQLVLINLKFWSWHSLRLLSLNQILHLIKLSLEILLGIINTFGAILCIFIIDLFVFKKRFGLLPDHREHVLNLVPRL